MVKVLVLGSTGFIGKPIALALGRAGHTVYGQTRGEAKAKELQAQEIIPVVADPSDVKSLAPSIASVDYVIDALGGPSNELAAPVFDVIKSSASGRLHPLTFIYISGTWVHGDNRDTVKSELETLDPAKSVPLVSWRAKQESVVLEAGRTTPGLRTTTIRPSLLYGYDGSLTGFLFGSAKAGKVTWPGTPGSTLGFIHTEDLADLVVKAVEKAPLVAGLSIVGLTNAAPTDAILAKLVKVSGASSFEYTKPTNPFEDAFNATILIQPTIGRDLLGWTPKKAPFLDGLEVYYKAWLATQ